jgi:hypothetical protein
MASRKSSYSDAERSTLATSIASFALIVTVALCARSGDLELPGVATSKHRKSFKPLHMSALQSGFVEGIAMSLLHSRRDCDCCELQVDEARIVEVSHR